ncbi:unnamed protein product [Urochloa humidicola]
MWEGDEIDQDTKDLEKEGSVVDMGETKQSNKFDGRSGFETERVKRDNTMERNEKQKLREWLTLEDDGEFVGGNNSSVEEEGDITSSPKKNLSSLEHKKELQAVRGQLATQQSRVFKLEVDVAELRQKLQSMDALQKEVELLRRQRAASEQAALDAKQRQSSGSIWGWLVGTPPDKSES